MSNFTPEQLAQVAALLSTFQTPTELPVATPPEDATPEPVAVAPVLSAVQPAPQARVQIPREQVRFDPRDWERKVRPQKDAASDVPKRKGLNILLRAWPVLLLCIPLVAWCFWSEPVKLFLIAWALVKMGVFGYFAAALDFGLNPNDQPEDVAEGITKGTAQKRRQWTVIAGMICGALAP